MSLIPVRILFIEDTEDDVILLKRHLQLGGYHAIFERVETADGLRSALHRGGWEIIISDYCMPRFSGMEALQITLEMAPEVPFMLISGTVGEEVAVESIKSGAADYLMKQNLIRFVPAVTRALRDAAERRTIREAETRLREQRSLLSMVFDNTSDSLSMYVWDSQDASWKIVAINQATIDFARRLGCDFDGDSVIGLTLAAVQEKFRTMWDFDSESYMEEFFQAAETGKPRTVELVFSNNSNEVFCEVNLVPFFAPDGRTRYTVSVGRDITSKKKEEQSRRNYEARLAQSRKMEALGQLAGGVAHDFNNILTAILGFSELIAKKGDPSTQIEAKEIVTAATRAKDLVQQILMFSRRQPAARKPLQFSSIIREVFPLIRSARGQNIAIVMAPTSNEPYINGDATQLVQVLLNLMTNACQAMMQTGGELKVSLDRFMVTNEFALAHAPLVAGEHLRVVVEDTGPGMPKHVLDRLFEPFFTTKPPGVGTGLGLSVVHGIVQNHDGAITVDSRVGEGTRFEIFFPIIHPPQPVTVIEKNMTNAKSAHKISRRVMFVDDEAQIIKLAQMMVKNLGHTIQTHNRPVEALEALKANTTAVDVIVTDFTMPDMNGIEFAKNIRTIGVTSPIILSSGLADDVPAETLKELGIVQVLQKPFQMQSLGEAILKATS